MEWFLYDMNIGLKRDKSVTNPVNIYLYKFNNKKN